MVVYIMRHGQTVWNKLGTIQGHSKNRLSQEGKIQVQEQAKEYANVKFDFIFSSPLVRTMQTANIMNQYHGVKIIKDNRIIEVDQGIYTGRNKKTMTDEDWKKYKTRSNIYKMESFDNIIARTRVFADDLIKNYKDKCVLIITHRSIAKALYYILLNKPIFNDDLIVADIFKNSEILKCDI